MNVLGGFKRRTWANCWSFQREACVPQVVLVPQFGNHCSTTKWWQWWHHAPERSRFRLTVSIVSLNLLLSGASGCSAGTDPHQIGPSISSPLFFLSSYIFLFFPLSPTSIYIRPPLPHPLPSGLLTPFPLLILSLCSSIHRLSLHTFSNLYFTSHLNFSGSVCVCMCVCI